MVMKELVLSESSEGGLDISLLCRWWRGGADGRLPDCLDGTHANEHADGLGFCGSYTPYQGYHNRDDIHGLGVARRHSQRGEKNKRRKDSQPCDPLSR